MATSIYRIDDCHLVTMATVPLKQMSLLERVVSVGLTLRDLSSSFTCPIHCGQSGFLAFFAGLSTGLFIGLLASFVLGFYLFRVYYDLSAPPDLGLARAVNRRLLAYRE